MPQPHDTPEANIARLRAGFAALERGDLEACVAMLAPDFAINIAGVPYPRRGPDAWRGNAGTMLAAFGDLRIHEEDLVAAGDKVAVRARITGIHQGEFLGTPATGRRVDYLSHEVYRFKDGKIAEEWICSDTLTLLAQIGAVDGTRLLLRWLMGFRAWAALAAGLALGAAGAVLAQLALA